MVAAVRVSLKVTLLVGSSGSPSCGKKDCDQRRNPAVRSTVIVRLTTVRLPPRSLTSTRKRYRPSTTAAPAIVLPFHVTDPPVPAVTFQDLTRVAPLQIDAVPVTVSGPVQPRTTLSAAPSRLGEKLSSEAVWVTAGGVVSTTTASVRRAVLPALSMAMRLAVYRPSGTRVPASLVPLQVNEPLAPLPVAVRTTVPPAFARRTDQLVAPVERSVNRTDSRLPSPFGEIREAVAAADVRTGSVRSTVIPNAASWAGVTGRADGAWYIRPPAVPTSCSAYEPLRRATPPTLPSQSHVRLPAARSGTARDPMSVPSDRYTFSLRVAIATVAVQRMRSVSPEPSPSGENARRPALFAPVIEPDPKSRSRRPASTTVLFGAREAATRVVEDELAASQTPCSTNETGDHSAIGCVTSYQV